MKDNIIIAQGRASSIGAKILSFEFRELTEDFKEENTEKESIQYGIPIIFPLHNPFKRTNYPSHNKKNLHILQFFKQVFLPFVHFSI